MRNWPGLPDWYQILDVEPSASTDDIRAAYRRLARTLHPDSRDPALPSADADAALRLLNEAWSILGDDDRRAAYDEGLEETDQRADTESWSRHAPRFPWWLVALAVLFLIFVFTAYAGDPTPPPTP